MSKVEVGSLWVAKEDYPLCASVREGDVVTVKEVLDGARKIIYVLLTERDIWWSSNFDSWDNHFKPYDGELAMNLGYFNYPDIDDTVDNVNSPSHYGQGKIEAIDYIKDSLTKEEYIGYLRGNIAKYLHRWRYKNGLEDLKKAQVYLGWLIQEVE